MSFTGCDSIVFTFESPLTVFARMLAAVLDRWPGVLVKYIDRELAASAPVPGAAMTPPQLPDEGWVFLYVRDTAMSRHMDEYTYVPMADGDGPFAVHCRIRRGVEFRCEGLDEVRVTDDPPNVHQIEPYQAWVCSPIVHEITAVTPGDPDQHPFSAWVLESVKRACGRPA